MNNYMFWNDYLNKTYFRIKNMLATKEKIHTDFHIHSDYSADGKQTLKEIIDRSNRLGLGVIAITDHDSLGVYDELYEYLQEDKNVSPIIVPGIEFTVENEEYGSQCHVLQLMVNPKEKNIMKNVEHNLIASWNRTEIQFRRIKENVALQFIFNKYDINCSINGYKEFLKSYVHPIPEYSTLSDYLMSLLKEKYVTVWEVLEKLEESNNLDKCEVRKQMKTKRYAILREKYAKKNDSNYNSRFLLSCIAVKGVDDDYFHDYESCGSLSVNNYGELKIEDLNRNHITILAHPNEDKMHTINGIIERNSNICGLEFNKQSKYENAKVFFDKLKECNLMMIIGSDSHSNDSEWYEDMDYYVMDKKELDKFLEYSKKYYALGLNKNDVTLVDENPNWKELFETEKDRLQALIGEYVLDIEHVGSTAIPNLKAKPIIDISIAVNELDDVLKFKDILIKNKYNFRDDGGVKGEYLFSKGPEECRTHYIHVVTKDSKRFHDHIVFRDYLLRHPETVVEYEKIKEDLIKKYPHERKKYTEGKNEFITNIIEKADIELNGGNNYKL